MSRHDSLLGRIARRASAPGSVHGDEPGVYDVERSIARNLQRLLSCRAGSSPALPDYGLPHMDRSTEGFGEEVRRFCTELEDAIRRYEPRVENVRVAPRRLADGQYDADPMHLTLVIKSTLVGASHRSKFPIRFTPDGRCTVLEP
ncbi:MAG: type VI secretion system baseplate subunit TssE [Planctomycetota bacterium]